MSSDNIIKCNILPLAKDFVDSLAGSAVFLFPQLSEVPEMMPPLALLTFAKTR